MNTRLLIAITALSLASITTVVSSVVFVGDASIMTDADDITPPPAEIASLPTLEPLPSNFQSALNAPSGNNTPSPGGGAPQPGAALQGVPVSLAGADRVATSIAVAEADFVEVGSAAVTVGMSTRSGLVARAAVLVSSVSFADALTAGPLAFDKVAPLLLTGRDALDSRVAGALTRLVPRSAPVFVVGGESAVGPAVVAAVEQLGYTVTRLAGADRYATSLAVARDGLGSPSTVFVATGLAFPDALAAGAVAARRDAAVLLTQGETVPAGVADYLRSTAGVTVHAVGGPAVRGLAAAGIAATAYQGADRYATATALATAFAPTGGVVGAASGEVFPDGLVSAPYLARRSGVLVLVKADSVPNATSNYLRLANGVSTVQVFGGLRVVSDATRRAIADLL